MKRILSIFAAALLGLAANAQNNPLEVKQFELSNGMQVWVNQDSSQPIVYGAVVVRAGGKDCPDTGLAHYLEHLLFKGTEEIGTVDYESEKVWLDSIAICYDKLSTLTDDAERNAMQKEINRLSKKAADYAIPVYVGDISCFSPVLYIKNFLLVPHCDALFFKGGNLVSAGVDITAELANILFLPFSCSIGARIDVNAGSAFDILRNAGLAKRVSAELIFSIDI